MADLMDVVMDEHFQAFCEEFREAQAHTNYRYLTMTSLAATAKTYMVLGRAGGTDNEMLLAIAKERQRQNEKFGDQSSRTDDQWHSILMEEMGEVHRELCEIMFLEESIAGIDTETVPRSACLIEIGSRYENVKAESIQVAAVAAAWFQSQSNRRKSHV